MKQSIAKPELKLSFWDKFTHYGVVIFLLTIPVLFLLFYVLEYYKGSPGPLSIVGVGLFILSLIIAAISYKLQRKRLRFKIVETKLSKKEIYEIIKEVAKELKWERVTVNAEVYVAVTDPSFLTGSWGERITIVFQENRVLVNSICDPDKSSSVIAFGRNIKNEKKIIKEIKRASRSVIPITIQEEH